MNIILPTFIIFVLCAVGIGIGLLIKGRPLQKRCSSSPDETCHCRNDDCKQEAGK